MKADIIKAIGATVYDTESALNGNKAFLHGLASRYPYFENCLYNDEFHLWFYVGTPPEIATEVLNRDSQRYKFPAIFLFTPIRENFRERNGICYASASLGLTLVASTFSEWQTDKRIINVFEPLLEPVYEEFIRQIGFSKAFYSGVCFPHDKWQVPTTGDYQTDMVSQWGDFLDGIHIRNLELTLNQNLCYRDIAEIEESYNFLNPNNR